MKSETYETPSITVLGEITDMTQKYGIYFDYAYSAEGKGTIPAPGKGVTFS
jgi:hypothetical protein